jgi:hypothetical protein
MMKKKKKEIREEGEEAKKVRPKLTATENTNYNISITPRRAIQLGRIAT